MNIALLMARVGLSLVFLVAGLTKLADLKGSRQALRDFGVPAWLATPAGLLLPLAELAVAVALLPLASAWWAAVGALALLLLFIAGKADGEPGLADACACPGPHQDHVGVWAEFLVRKEEQDQAGQACLTVRPWKHIVSLFVRRRHDAAERKQRRPV